MPDLDLLCFEKMRVWELDKLPFDTKKDLEERNIQDICGSTVTDSLERYDFNFKEIKVKNIVSFLARLDKNAPLFKILNNKMTIITIIRQKKYMNIQDSFFDLIGQISFAPSYVLYYLRQN